MKEIEGSAVTSPNKEIQANISRLSTEDMSELSDDQRAEVKTTMSSLIDFNKLRKQICVLASLDSDNKKMCEENKKKCLEAMTKIGKTAPNFISGNITAERYMLIAQLFSEFFGSELSTLKCGGDTSEFEKRSIELAQKYGITTSEVKEFILSSML